MTQEQFYYCLSRIMELREKLAQAQAALKDVHVAEPGEAGQGQIDFKSLQHYSRTKSDANLNAAEANALIKELSAQEEKIRAFVPLPLYGTRIKATQPGLPSLFVVVETQNMSIEKLPI